MLKVERFIVGAIHTNCYLINDEKSDEYAIIDPGGLSTSLDSKIKKIDPKKIKYILITHGHFDHILKVKKYKDLTGAKVIICKHGVDFIQNPDLNLSVKFSKSSTFDVDILVKDGEILKFGEHNIKVIETPGHTIDGVCYLIENKMFSGDTIFKNEIGRWDLKTGSKPQMYNSLKKLSNLNKDYKIFPGHGDSTSLNYEKNNNEYFQEILN